jgi:hypothetical protein
MSEDFHKSLKDHFKQVDASRTAAQSRGDAVKQETERRKQHFEAQVRDIIEPVLMTAREELLTRNYPAEVIREAPPGVRATEGYIGLNSSNDIKHISSVSTQPLFRMCFMADRGGIQFYSTRVMIGGVPESNKTIPVPAPVDRAKVESLVFDAIRACFPV